MRICVRAHRWWPAAAVGILLAAWPLIAAAQLPPIPHVFLGSLVRITVDGAPVDEDVVIDAVDSSGLVVATAATAATAAGRWTVQTSPAVGSVRFRIGAALSEPFPVQAGGFTELETLALSSGIVLAATREVELDAGFNLVGWTGPDTPIEEVLTLISGEVLALYVWDGGTQEFDTYRVGLPGTLNTLTALEIGDGVWIRMSGSGVWSLPDEITDARAVNLVRGFNLEVWSGTDSAPIEEAMATLTSGGRFEDYFTVFQFDPVTRTFRSYAPNRLTLLNDIETLAHGEAVWVVLINASATWTQPAP